MQMTFIEYITMLEVRLSRARVGIRMASKALVSPFWVEHYTNEANAIELRLRKLYLLSGDSEECRTWPNNVRTFM